MRWPRPASDEDEDEDDDTSESAGLLDDLLVVERHGTEFASGLEFELLRLAGERHLLAIDLIRAVLARRLDRHSVLAVFPVVCRLVLAVPPELVLARRFRGAAERAHDRRGLRHQAQAVRAVPGLELSEEPILVVPQRARSHRVLVFVFDPDGDERPQRSAAQLRNLKINRQLHRRIPRSLSDSTE